MKIYSRKNPQIYYEYDRENNHFKRYNGFESMDMTTLRFVFLAERIINGTHPIRYSHQPNLHASILGELRRFQNAY